MQDQTINPGTDPKDAEPSSIPARSYEADPGGSESPNPETDQFTYDTPYDGGSASDRAGIKAAKEGKLITDREDVEQAKEEVKKELGQ